MNQTRIALWHDDVQALHCSALERRWLAEQGSLSVRLASCAQQFRVQTLKHGSGIVPPDLRTPAHIATRIAASRSVLLRCDEVPVVFGHTVWKAQRAQADWPFLTRQRLGSGPLGGKLFADRQTQRMPLQFARLGRRHALVRYMRGLLAALPEQQMQTLEIQALLAPDCYYARRSVFRRRNGRILVTEVFFPALNSLSAVRRQPTLAQLMGTSKAVRETLINSGG